MKILVKPPKGEMTLEYWADMEYKRINMILTLIEEEFNVDMNQHPELRHYILDTSAYIRRLPQIISGGVEYEDKK